MSRSAAKVLPTINIRKKPRIQILQPQDPFLIKKDLKKRPVPKLSLAFKVIMVLSYLFSLAVGYLYFVAK